MDKTVTLRLVGDSAGFRADIAASTEAMNKAGRTGQQAGAQIGAGMQSASRQSAALQGVLAGVRNQVIGLASVAAAAGAIRSVAQLAEGYTNITGRLKLVADGEAALASARERTFRIAQRTNSQYEATAGLYSRLLKSTQSLGLAEQERIAISEQLSTAINQSFRISGSAAASAAAGVVQLSQGLASGVLRGDEFNSVMENSPRLAQAMADGLGVTTGELRKMAEQGALTSEVVIRALQSQAAAINADFARLPVTISAAWQNIENAVQRYVGEADQASGASASVAAALLGIANNIEPLLDAVVLLGQATAVVVTQRTVAALVEYGNGIRANVQAQIAAVAAERAAAAAAVERTRARAVDLTQTLEVITAARAELIAKQSLVSVDIAAAQATLKATEATAFLSGAMRARREATEQLTIAQARLNAISTEMAVLGRQQAAVQTQLAGAAAAQVAAQTAVAGSATLTSRALGALKTAGAALFSAIGGWVGIAAGAALGIWYLYDQAAEAEEQLREPIAFLGEYADSLNEVAEAEKAAAAGMTPVQAGVIKSFEEAERVIANMKRELEFARESLDNWKGSGDRVSMAMQGDLIKQVETLSDRLTWAEEQQAKLTQALVDNIIWVDGAADANKRYGESIGKVQDALEGELQSLQLKRIELQEGQRAALIQKALNDTGAKSIADLDSKTIDLINSIVSETDQLKKLEGAKRAAEKAAEDLRDRQREASQATLDQAAALTKLSDAADDARAEIDGPVAKAWRDHVVAIRAIAAEGAKAIEAAKKLGLTKAQEGAIQREVTKAIEAQNAVTERAIRLAQQQESEIRNRPSLIDQATRSLADEVAQLRLSNEERAIEEALLRATAIARKESDDGLRASRDLTAEEIAQIRERTSALYRTGEAIQQAKEYWSEYQQIGTRAVQSVGDAFGQFVASGFRDWRGFLDNMKQTFRQWLASIVSMMATRALTNGLAGLLGGGGNAGSGWWGQLLGSFTGGGGAGGGGFGNVLGMAGGGGRGFNIFSLFGGGGNAGALNASAMQSYGVLNTPTGTAAGSLGMTGTVLAGLGGAYYGYNRTNGGLAGVGAAASYGALGIGVAGTAAGLAGGATLGAAAGGAFSALGAAAAIPVVGWILAALAFIDLASGGKLFGTKFRPESATQALQVSPEGGAALTTVREVRQQSLFRGRKWRERTVDSSDEAIRAAENLFDALHDAMEAGARQLAIDVPPMIEGAIRSVQQYDKKGKPKGDPKIFVDVLGRSWEEADAERAQMRLTAEAIIATVAASVDQAAAAADPVLTPEAIADLVIGDTTPGDVRDVLDRTGNRFTQRDGGGGASGADAAAVSSAAVLANEVHRIAERWRDDAELLMQGANFLLAAQTDIKNGNNLLGDGASLTAITDFVEDLQRGQETLVDTYSRVRTSVALLDEALRLSGQAIEGTRQAVVTLAVDIADAAGSLETASALWNNYFETFYASQERATQQLDQAIAARDDALAGLGLGADTTNEQFRAAFEAALSTANAEQIVEWLRAGAAIRAAADAQAQYNQILDQAQAPARAYASAVQELGETLAQGRLTEFQREIREIDSWTTAAIAELNRLAVAAGHAGATESELAAVHELASIRAAQAMARLRQRAQDIVQQLYGSGLDRINAQIAEIETASSSMYQSQIDGLGAVDDAAQQTYDAQVSAQQRIREWLDNLLLSPLGGLRPRDQLAAGQTQFDALLQRALSGDAEAMAALPQLADQLLRLGQQVYASGDPYFALRDTITAALQQVASLQLTAPPASGNGGGGSVQIEASAELQALYAERDRLLAEQTAANRLQLAQDLASVIRDMATFTRDPLEEIAAHLGVNLTSLVADLGVNLSALTVTTASQLADVAQSMGVNLSELSAQVGVDLGALADRQSLLNDALEAEIAGLPASQRDLLAPLLARVESAAELGDTAGVEAGVLDLEDAINDLAPGLRDQLAPYFEAVQPVDMTQLDALQFIDLNTAAAASELERHSTILDRIANNLRAQNEDSGLPAYASGTTYVPRTGPALIHEGEMILPAPVARFLRQPIQTGGQPIDGKALQEEIRMLREAQADQARLIAELLKQLRGEVIVGANKQTAAIDRQTDVMKARK